MCPACWSRVVPDTGTRCHLCGRPVDDDAGPCLECQSSPPPQSWTVVWGEHDELLRRVILLAKHSGRDELVNPLAERLGSLIAGSLWRDRIDVVTAVPSHLIRRVRRGVVLSELVGRRVAAGLGLPWERLLWRHGLRRQAGQTRAARRALPAGSFKARTGLGGRNVLLVDDVVTTGSTLARASQALRRAGARAVYCAVLAAAPDSRRLG